MPLLIMETLQTADLRVLDLGGCPAGRAALADSGAASLAGLVEALLEQPVWIRVAPRAVPVSNDAHV